VIELPEALNIAGQLSDTIRGKRVVSVIVALTPHKLAWYYGEPPKYPALLAGKTIEKANAYGGMVEIKAENVNILLGEGAGIRFHRRNETRPARHQLLVEFTDSSAISVSIQMYGGIGIFVEGELDNLYYRAAKEKPSPLCPAFDEIYFDRLISGQGVQKLSLKAFLATEQRVPGLGNGILQDILFNAKLHPKKKVETLTRTDKEALYNSVKDTISAMAAQGGRDTELDLFGRPGGYRTILCRNTASKPCPTCGTAIKKEPYMGGSIYYCDKCQRL
jgi:formamidopyrimidine-DNA glycosylase